MTTKENVSDGIGCHKYTPEACCGIGNYFSLKVSNRVNHE
jgi:hypothetical protein